MLEMRIVVLSQMPIVVSFVLAMMALWDRWRSRTPQPSAQVTRDRSGIIESRIVLETSPVPSAIHPIPLKRRNTLWQRVGVSVNWAGPLGVVIAIGISLLPSHAEFNNPFLTYVIVSPVAMLIMLPTVLVLLTILSTMKGE